MSDDTQDQGTENVSRGPWGSEDAPIHLPPHVAQMLLGGGEEDYSLEEKRRAGALQFAVTLMEGKDYGAPRDQVALRYARAFETWLRDGDTKETGR